MRNELTQWKYDWTARELIEVVRRRKETVEPLFLELFVAHDFQTDPPLASELLIART